MDMFPWNVKNVLKYIPEMPCISLRSLIKQNTNQNLYVNLLVQTNFQLWQCHEILIIIADQDYLIDNFDSVLLIKV